MLPLKYLSIPIDFSGPAQVLNSKHEFECIAGLRFQELIWYDSEYPQLPLTFVLRALGSSPESNWRKHRNILWLLTLLTFPVDLFSQRCKQASKPWLEMCACSRREPGDKTKENTQGMHFSFKSM